MPYQTHPTIRTVAGGGAVGIMENMYFLLMLYEVAFHVGDGLRICPKARG
jgi:hypothetical protein